MRKIIFLIIFAFTASLTVSAFGDHLQNTSCSVSIIPKIIPVMYDGENRNNPDKTYYPGDAFNYIFKIKGSESCLSFGPRALESEGAVDVLSHYKVFNEKSNTIKIDPIASKTVHPHVNFNWFPKYIEVTYYYKVVDYIERISCSRGFCSDWLEPVYSETPFAMLKEGQNPKTVRGVFKSDGYTLRDDVKAEKSFMWDLVRNTTPNTNAPKEETRYEDKKSISDFHKIVKSTCSTLGKYEGCIFGHAEIDTEIVDEICLISELNKKKIDHGLTADQDVCKSQLERMSLQVIGTKLSCDENECKVVRVAKTTKTNPIILEPLLDLIFDKTPVYDSDLYAGKNLDETYYVWDPISIKHIPDFKWKDERIKTIQFEVSKTYDLKNEIDFQCEDSSCDWLLNHSGLAEQSIQLGHGEGMTIYNATTLQELGKHGFEYTIKVFNINEDRLLNVTEADTDVLVVKYEPVYSHNNAYLVLKDDKGFSWGNRHGIAMMYEGSVGGGPDDTDGIHPDRRSKINDFSYNLTAVSGVTQRDMPQPLHFSEANPVQNGPVQCKDAVLDPTAFEGNSDDTAMFVHSGFGTIYFASPLMHPMLKDRLVNATVSNQLTSVDFGGVPLTHLTNYTYQFPDSKFSNTVKILVKDSEGKTEDTPISVSMVPDYEKGAMQTHDYVCEKITKDSGISEFGQIAVDDMYGAENYEEDIGILNLKVRMISTYFPSFYSVLGDDPLDLIFEEGFNAPSPYIMQIKIGDKVTRTINSTFSYTSPFVEIVNYDQNNELNLNASNGRIKIFPSSYFGDIEFVSVNDEELERNCSEGCTFTNFQNDTLSVKAVNKWGGVAYGEVDNVVLAPKDADVDLEVLGIIMMLAVILGMIFLIAPKIVRHYGDIITGKN